MDDQSDIASDDLLDALPVGVLTLSRDPTGKVRFLGANAEARRLLGLPDRDGARLAEALRPAAAEALAQAARAAAAEPGGAPRSVELAGPDCDVEIVLRGAREGRVAAAIVAERARTQARGGDEARAMGTGASPHEIADPAHAARCAVAAAATGVGVFEWRVAEDRLTWDDAMRRIFGVGPDHPIARYADFSAFLAPGERDRLEAARGAAGADGVLSAEFDILRPDGERRRILARSRVVERDAQGRPAAIAGANLDVTEQRAAEARALRAEGLLRDAIEAVPDAFAVYDPEDRLVAVNSAALRLAPGFAASATPGRRYADIIRESVARGAWPEAAGREEAWIAERLAAHRAADGRRREQRAAEGALLRVVDVATREGGRVVLGVDVAEERRALDRAERAEQRFAEAADALTDGFVIYDAEDRLVYANRRYREIYAESAEAMVPGARFEDVIRFGVARGQYPEAEGREEAWIAERLAAHRRADRTVEQALPGDRWLRVVERRTPAGETVGLRIDISELKRQQAALEAARVAAEEALADRDRTMRELERFFDLSLDLLGIAAPDGRFAKLNRAWETLLGRPLDALIGAALADFTHPEDLAEASSMIAACRRGEPALGVTLRVLAADGAWRALEWRTATAEDGAIHFAAREVTERERAMEERSRRAAAEAALGRITEAAQADTDEAEFLTAACAALVGEAGGWHGLEEQAVACILEPGGGRAVGRVGVSAAEARTRAGRAAARLTASPDDGVLREPGPRAAERDWLITPVRSGAETLGALALCASRRGEPPAETVALLERAARSVALGLERRRAAARAEEERRRAVAALGELRTYMDALERHAILSVCDAQGRVQSVNEGFCAISGYARDELIGRPLAELNPDIEESAADAMRAEIRAGRSWRGEIPMRAKDGRIYWVDATVIPVFGPDGAVEQVVDLAYDVTERRRMQEALRDANHRLALTAEMSGAGGWRYDPASDRVEWDAITRRILGVADDYAPSMERDDAWFAEADRETVRTRLAECVEARRPFDIEARITDAAGNPKWVRMVGQPVGGGPGPGPIAGVFQDITKRRRREEQNRRLRARFEGVIENAHIHMFLVSRDGRIVAANRAFLRARGAARVDGMRDLEGFPPDDAAAIRAVDARIFETGEPALVEERVTLRGEERTFVTSKFLLPDEESGEPVLCVVAAEITEQKRREEEAARAFALLDQVFEATDALIWIKSESGRFIRINRRFRDFHNAPEEPSTEKEALALASTGIVGPVETLERVHEEDAEVARTGRGRVDEIDLTVRGERRTLVMSRFAVRDPETGERAVCGLATDMTDMKRREREAETARDRLRRLIDNAPFPILVKAASGRFLDANPAFNAVHGVDDCRGATDDDFNPPEIAERLRAEDREVLASGERLFGESEVAVEGATTAMLRAKFPLPMGDGQPDAVCVVAVDLTEQKRRQAEAERARRRFEEVFRNAASPMALKRPDGRFIMGNRIFLEMFGLDDVAGLRTEDFVPPPYADEFKRRSDRVFETGAPVTEAISVPFAGETRHMIISRFLIPDAESGEDVLCIVGTDITEQKRREEESAQARERIQRIFDNVPFIMFLKDREGRFRLANPSFRRMHEGRDPTGLTDFDLLPPDLAARLHETDAALLRAGRSATMEVETETPNGSRVMLASKFPLRMPGEAEDWLCGVAVDITEQKRREREAAAARDRVQRIFDNTATPMFVKARDGRIVMANRTYRESFGRRPVIGARDETLHDPEAAARFRVNDERVFEMGEPFFGEETAVVDGVEKTYLVSKFLIPDPRDERAQALCCVATDITEQRRRETEIARIRARFEAVFENTDAVMFIKRRDGSFIAANRRFLEDAGVSSIDGRLDADLRDGSGTDAIAEHDRRVFETGQRFLGEETLTRPDGRRAVYLASKFLIPDPALGEDVLCAICSDITELKRLQAEAEENRVAADTANAAKSQFLATMSHEIRTPMNGVLGMTDLLAHSGLDARQSEMLNIIRESGRILLNVINDILDVSKIEAGGVRLERTAFRCAELADRLRPAHAHRASERGVALTMRSEDDAAARLGDPHRIEQILNNLISNAIKFAEKGRVEATLRGRGDEEIEIEVRDDGIGMTTEQAERIFEPFSQADSSTTRRYGGTGLGLSIVKGLVEAMDGRIELETAPGRGARFTVVIPAPATRETGTAPETEEADHASLSGLRVLAADDNDVNRMVVAAFLERLGVSARIVESGRAAVAAAREEAFDALLLDISMPDIDGLEALRLIRAEEGERGVAPTPAIAVTANALPEQIDRFHAAGFEAHAPKPLQRATLAAALAATARRDR